SIIASLIPLCPKEILIEISKFINTIYPKLKDSCINSYMVDDTVKRRELVWKNITKKIQDVLYPLIHAINTVQKPLLHLSTQVSPVENVDNVAESMDVHALNHAIKTYTKRHSDNIYWPIPWEINFLQIKDADDVATITCKVGNITIPYAMIDSGSDSSIILENVAKYLGLKIDRKKVHRLNGVISKSQSLGTVNDVSVIISSGDDCITVTDEFSVVPTEYDNGKELSLFILGTQWQYRAGWEPLIKGEFRATCDGKTITIPLSVHKSQRNVFKVENDGDISETIKKTIL